MSVPRPLRWLWLLALLGVLLLPTAALADTEEDPYLQAASVDLSPQSPAPAGIAVLEDGTLAVTDYSLDRVVRFGADGSLLAEWGSSGSAPGQLSGPFGIAADASGTLYVAEQLNNRVQKFATDGAPLGVWGAAGAEPGQLRTPFGLTIANGRLFVADFGNDRVQIFTPDGMLLRAWGTHGSDLGQFLRPADVAVDTQGGLYVSDYFNDRVQHLLPDGRTVQVIGGSLMPAPLGTPVVGPTLVPTATVSPTDPLLSRPEGVALDQNGNLLVVDYGHSRVARYSPDGRLLGTFGTPNFEDSGLLHPKGIAVDSFSGRVYVADTGNGRVVRYLPDGTFDTAWPMPGLGQ